MRLTKELEERRHKAEEERKKLEMERVAAELEQKRAMDRANLEKEEKERMVIPCLFIMNSCTYLTFHAILYVNSTPLKVKI